MMVWTKGRKTAFSIAAITGVLLVGWLGFTFLDRL